MSDGRPLDEVLSARGALPPREAARVGAGIARAIAEAHAEGIVHGTLCPRNVHFDGERVRIVRYGVERAERAAHTTRAGGVDVYALRFMAPEQLQGDAPDAPEDSYSLGAVLFALCAGRTPFQHHAAFPLLATAILTERPPRLQDVPPDLARLVEQLLDRDPIRRPSACEAAEWLDALAAGAASPLPPTFRRERPTDTPYALLKALVTAVGGRTIELWRRVSTNPRVEEMTRGLIGDGRVGFRWCEHRDLETSAMPLACHGRTHGLEGLEVVFSFELDASGQAGFAVPRHLVLTVRASDDEARARFVEAWRETFGEEPQP